MANKVKRAALSCVLGLSLATVSGNALADRTVQVGGSANYDACGSVGKVTGLNPKGDNFLAVRARPSGRGRLLDKLGPGQRFYVCESQGQWLGIVYGRGCGVSSPVARRQAYRGPCRSGWVFRRYTTDVAG